jgi:hypothetical protein
LDFFTFSTKVPLRFVTYLPKVAKIATKNLHSFQHYKLTLVTNAPKKVIHEKNLFPTQGTPLCTVEILYPGISFLGAFVTKVSL